MRKEEGRKSANMPRDPTIGPEEDDSSTTVIPKSQRKKGASKLSREYYPAGLPPGATIVEIIPEMPMRICPYCGFGVCPVLSYEPSPLAYLWCILITILLMPFFCIGLLIGLMILSSGACQSPRYVCPVCGSSLSGPMMI